MNQGRSIFSQLTGHLPHKQFTRCVQRYEGERYVKSFSCMDQYLCMAFAQLTFRESLRDIECCLRAHHAKLHHIGIRSSVSRSTLAHANDRRDWRIWADFAYALIGTARELYANDRFGVKLSQTAYVFDSTTTDLCLSLFPWARFRKTKAAVKAHTLLDLRGNIPCWIHVTSRAVHDVNVMDLLPIEPGSFYILDRGYLGFARLHAVSQQAAFLPHADQAASADQVLLRHQRKRSENTTLARDRMAGTGKLPGRAEGLSQGRGKSLPCFREKKHGMLSFQRDRPTRNIRARIRELIHIRYTIFRSIPLPHPSIPGSSRGIWRISSGRAMCRWTKRPVTRSTYPWKRSMRMGLRPLDAMLS